jgi:hypothetical protein
MGQVSQLEDEEERRSEFLSRIVKPIEDNSTRRYHRFREAFVGQPERPERPEFDERYIRWYTDKAIEDFQEYFLDETLTDPSRLEKLESLRTEAIRRQRLWSRPVPKVFISTKPAM